MPRHADMWASHAMPSQLDGFGESGTYTDTSTGTGYTRSGRLTEIGGDENDRIAELAIYTDATNGIADPQRGDTWTEAGGTVWEVSEVIRRTGGRHLIEVFTPREQESPIL